MDLTRSVLLYRGPEVILELKYWKFHEVHLYLGDLSLFWSSNMDLPVVHFYLGSLSLVWSSQY